MLLRLVGNYCGSFEVLLWTEFVAVKKRKNTFCQVVRQQFRALNYKKIFT